MRKEKDKNILGFNIRKEKDKNILNEIKIRV